MLFDVGVKETHQYTDGQNAEFLSVKKEGDGTYSDRIYTCSDHIYTCSDHIYTCSDHTYSVVTISIV